MTANFFPSHLCLVVYICIRLQFETSDARFAMAIFHSGREKNRITDKFMGYVYKILRRLGKNLPSHIDCRMLSAKYIFTYT